MKRFGTALIFFIFGLSFVGALSLVSVLDCNELCPDWFNIYLLAYYAMPLVWLVVGLTRASKPRLVQMGIALAAVNLLALVGVSVGTNHFVSW